MLSCTGQAAMLLLLSFAGLLVGQAQADVMGSYGKSETCGLTVFDMMGSITWLGGTATGYYVKLCTNPNAVVSLYAAIAVYCADDIESAQDFLRRKCTNYAYVEITTPEALAANLTPEAIAALPVRSRAVALEMVSASAPFLADEAWFAAQYKTDDAWGSVQRHHAWYTISIYFFWLIILSIGMIQNAIRMVVEGRRGYVYVDAEGQGQGQGKAASGGSGFVSRCDALVRKYVTTPSALPPYHSQRIFGCTIPTRAESFVVLSFWIINIVLGFVSYPVYEGNLYWSAKSSQVWRYMADRTGYMSYGNIPLMYMFSGRNNIFLPLTGWSFGTFNIFHRHIARISTLQAIMHSIGYTAFYFGLGKGASYRADYQELWFALGVAATVVMSFIVLFSFSIFRAKLYESFLLVHIVLSVLVIVFLWYHTSIFAYKQFNHPFLTSAAAVWGFDRLLRLVRQAYVNLHVRRGRGSGRLRFTDTTVTYHADADMLVIDTVPANPHLLPGPGQHYYLYQPLRFLGWENHPFTLATWTTPKIDDAAAEPLRLQFWVRPFGGWTKTLRKECERKGKATAAAVASGSGTGSSSNVLSFDTTMLLEGPYGKREPIHCFEEVLLVAGGSGIAGVLPYLLDFVQRVDRERPDSATASSSLLSSSALTGAAGATVIPTRTRRVTLVWADRREAFLRFVADGVLADLMNHPQLRIHLHQTSSTAASLPAAGTSTASSSTEAVQTMGSNSSSSSSSSSSHKGGEDKSAFVTGNERPLTGTNGPAAAYHIQAGRPDVLATVESMAQAVRGTEERLAVMVCGPNVLADAVRGVVVRNMETQRDAIEYFEESFGW